MSDRIFTSSMHLPTDLFEFLTCLFPGVQLKPRDVDDLAIILTKYGNPQEWSPSRKKLVLSLSCAATFVTTYTPGAYSAGLPQYQAEWDVNTIQVYLGLTLFTLLFALAPMFLASLSELSGRRPLFVAAGIVYVASQLGSGFTASFAGLLVTRALAGVSCSVFSTVVGGVISDMHIASERNAPMAIFTGAVFCGLGLGPLISSVIAQNLDWRWIYHVQSISCGTVVAGLYFFFPETRGDVILSRRAKEIDMWCQRVDGRPEGERPSWVAQSDEQRATLTMIIITSLKRPIHLLFTESVVFWFSLWMSFAWSILYVSFDAVPLIFTDAYNFSSQESGFVFAAVVVASIIGTFAAIWQGTVVENPESWIYRYVVRGSPEARLLFSCAQSLLLPLGLFWLGTTARPSIPWIVPALSVGVLTLGIFSVYLAVFNYLADVYHMYSSSAIAAQSFSRNLFAALLPLAIQPLLNSSLSILGTGSFLGGIALLIGVVPWVLVAAGSGIRARSKIASEIALG
ncbi:major facilitator superfamily domain-containing protein [Xylariaceae sp. FL1019]|nr:major facilitator superfamily domain-containing protein [Xylariaceae sp. FL1019]